MAVDKEIKFKFVVDQTSLQSAKRQIEELVSAFSNLQGQAQKAVAPTQKLMNTILGPDGSPISSGEESVSGRPVASTVNSSVSTKKITTSNASASISNSVTGVLNRHKSLFKGYAEAGKEGVDYMTRILKRGVQEQTNELDKLEKKLDNIQKKWAKKQELYQKAVGAGETESADKLKSQMDVLDMHSVIRKGQVEQQKISLKQAQEMLYGPEPEPQKSKYSTGKGTWSNLIANRGLTGQLTSGQGGMFAPGALLPSLLRGIGVGRLGLAGLGLWGLQGIATQAWNAPNLQAQSDAAYGQTFGARSLEMRRGELRNIAKEQEILSDPTKRQEYQDIGSDWRRFVHNAKAFATFRFNDALSSKAADIGVQQEREERIAMERAADPLIDQILGEAQDYRSTLGKMRALGISGRNPKSKQMETGFAALNRVREMAPTFSDEEIIAAKQSIESAGTRRKALGLTSGVLQAQAAGIAGIAQTTGLMSNFGVGNQFLNTARSYVGGGADAVTTGIIAQEVARQQQQLGLATGSIGGGFQGQGLMAMLSGGTSDKVFGRLNAEQNIRGAHYMQMSLAGETSPYQKARNLMIAAQVAPELSSYGQSFLAKHMSLTEMADVAYGKGGDVSAIAKSYGITSKNAKDFFREQPKTLMEGISFQGLQNDPAGILAKMLTSSKMDSREFFKKKMWKGAFEKEEDAIAAYAGALKAADASLDPSSAMGLARNLSGTGTVKPGGKAGDSAGGSPEAKLAAEHVKLMGNQAQKAASALELLTKAATSLYLRQNLESELNYSQANSEQRRRINTALGELAGHEEITDPKKQLEFIRSSTKEQEVVEELSNGKISGETAREILFKHGYESTDSRIKLGKKYEDLHKKFPSLL